MTFYSGNINSLSSNEIFVFGSNPEGRHGAGSAKLAREKFGAIYSNGRGIQGNSYALPTKNLTPGFTEQISKRKKITYIKSGEKSLTLDMIHNNVKELYSFARKNKDLKFYIAYQNSSRNLNGYSSEEMFNTFTKNLKIPKNIIFSDTFKQLAIDNNLIKTYKYTPLNDGITHINVYSKGATELGKLLTNMSNVPTNIFYEGKEYKFKSVEGYWYFLKLLKASTKPHFELQEMSCFKAKEYAKKLLSSLPNIPENETMIDQFFKDNISLAIKNKIINNNSLLELFISNNLPFTHYYYYGKPEDNSIVELEQHSWITDFLSDFSNSLKDNLIVGYNPNLKTSILNLGTSEDENIEKLRILFSLKRKGIIKNISFSKKEVLSNKVKDILESHFL